MKAAYLVCYDIANPRRLSRVYRFLKGMGRHLQYSVFHCVLTWTQLTDLEGSLREFIDEKEDDIRIYPLPAGDKVFVLGRGDRLPDGVDLFIS